MIDRLTLTLFRDLLDAAIDACESQLPTSLQVELEMTGLHKQLATALLGKEPATLKVYPATGKLRDLLATITKELERAENEETFTPYCCRSCQDHRPITARDTQTH